MRAGDWVEVKSAQEITASLDAEMTLDGLPFMPEMLEHCGRRYRVSRVAEKTCVEIPGGAYVIREFRNNDVVLLETLRCSGAEHDGCQRACMLLWKKSWLRQVEANTNTPSEAEALPRSSSLKTKVGPDRYFCQSTELVRATLTGSMSYGNILLKCLRDISSGAVGIPKMMALIFVPACRKLRDSLLGRPRLVGELTRTPVGTLNLQPGETVEIRSQEEMRQTLDQKGRNRGLVCDIELKKFCGTRDRVRGRLDRMISEPTGEMRQVQGTVLLESNMCMCARVVGGCPRLEFTYWREVWLKRVPTPNVSVGLGQQD